MDLNLPLVNDGSDEEIQQIRMMGSFHVPSNQVGSEENSGRRLKALGMVPDWVTKIMNRGNNHRTLKQFQKMNSPVFEGVVNPLQVGKWLLQIEKILDVMNYSKDQRLSFTTFILQEEA